MPPTDETPARAAPAPSSRRRAVLWGSLVVVLVVALGLAGVALAQRSAALTRQAQLAQQWSDDVDAWQLDSIAVVPEPAVRLGPLLSGAATETADGIAAIRAECDRAASAATTAAAPPAAPAAPTDLPASAEGYGGIADRVADSTDALGAYADATGAAAQSLADLCAVYPDLAQITLDQAAAIADLTGRLGACDLADIGCLPRDRGTWGEIADAVDAAYADPERRRAELYAGACPAPSLTAICTTLSTNATALLTLGEQYALALRDASPASITAARDAVAAQREANAASLVDVAAPLLSPEVGDPEVAVAQAYRQLALDADAAWLGADSALLVALD